MALKIPEEQPQITKRIRKEGRVRTDLSPLKNGVGSTLGPGGDGGWLLQKAMRVSRAARAAGTVYTVCYAVEDMKYGSGGVLSAYQE